MLSALLLTAALMPQGPTVVINELNYDDSSTDDVEFVELYNPTGATVDIGGWTLVGEEGSAGGAANGSVTIPAGTMLLAGDYYVVGQPAVPNVDLDIGGLGLENGPDGVYLQDANQQIVDGVVWEYANWTAAAPSWLEGDGLFGDIQGHQNSNGTNSISRVSDGVDTDDNGCDFRPQFWSPGTSNDTVNTTRVPYVNRFDDPVGSTVDSDFLYSFVPGTTADPAALGIQPSPQGGNCSSWIDPTGGGNANWLMAASRENWILETYIHVAAVDAVGFDADDGEAFVIGVRGHSDSFGELPNVGGYQNAINCDNQSGHTGIAWMGIRTQAVSELYLVDFNNGGGDFTVRGGPVSIVAGMNDGWQRLRLCVLGGDVVANFGGTFGCDDGTRFTASGVTQCSNGVYLTYRECLTVNSVQNGLTLDALTIGECAGASVSFRGSASPTNSGTPTIGANGLPSFGNAAFGITGTGLVPSSAGAFCLVGLPIAGTQVPGAPAGALIYVNNILGLVAGSDPGGNALFGLPIPCDSSLSGIALETQIVDIDATLAAFVAIGTSRAMTATIGQ